MEGDRIKVYLTEEGDAVLLNCFQNGELVTQLVLDADEALEHACSVLMTALAVKRHQAERRATPKPKLELGAAWGFPTRNRRTLFFEW